LDGEGFILQVQRVFTRIRSGDTCDNLPGKIPYYRLRPIHFGR
jgi:hypothetical protein